VIYNFILNFLFLEWHNIYYCTRDEQVSQSSQYAAKIGNVFTGYHQNICLHWGIFRGSNEIRPETEPCLQTSLVLNEAFGLYLPLWSHLYSSSSVFCIKKGMFTLPETPSATSHMRH
jgi:hypothetical protein